MALLPRNFIQSEVRTQQATCDNLICCKTGLNVGGQKRNIAIQFVSQQLQTKLHVFVIRFTVALVNKQICTNAHLTENLSVAVERSSD